MPRYVKTKRVTHFSDTLRIWGFARLKRKGKDKGCYYHKYFVRGNPSLSRHQSREQMKKAMESWPQEGGEPDLYQPPPSSPTPQVPTTNTMPTLLQLPNPPATLLQSPNPLATTTAKAPPAPAHTDPVSIHAGSTLHTNYALSAIELQGSQARNSSQKTPPTTTATALTTPDPASIYYDPSRYHVSPPAVAAVVAYNTPTDKAKASDGTYVLRIHEMLEDAEKEGNQKIISWQPHGRAFRVHKEKDFVEKIMPRYFRAKIGSFRRWLRAWGFCRMTEGKDRGAWYHRYFVRGLTYLCRNMTRQQMLKVMEDWLPPGQVPDFYASGRGNVLSEIHKNTAESSASNLPLAKNPKKLRGTVLEDLRQMLEEAETSGNQAMVSWLPHGRAFKVHQKNQFVQKIMPRYFKATKFTYFSDTLRIWGFARLKRGKDKGAYFHRNFVRGEPGLSRHLSRTHMRQAMAGWPPEAGEPDLYSHDAARLLEESMPQVSPADAPAPLLTQPTGAYPPNAATPSESHPHLPGMQPPEQHAAITSLKKKS